MKIAVGNSRMDKKWKNREISWEDFCKKVSVTQRTTETVEEYRKLRKGRQDNIKDVGGFVGGHLKEGRRKNGNVLCRSMLTLDVDYGTPEFWEELKMFSGFRCCVYSTHKHTPEKPRLRLIIPLSREVSEDEYPALGRMVAKELGIDLFDDTTYEPCRLMYWPSTSVNGDFFFDSQDGEELNPDTYLSKYNDWRDASTWPVSSRQSEVIKHTLKEQADPTTKPGVVGAFCRAYTIEDAIESFLQDVYEPSAIKGRYDYKPADSAAGLVIYGDKFAYSHHATDPVCGQLLNAFDIVRLHRFADLDENASVDTAVTKLPSYKAMCDFALQDSKVKAVYAQERQAEAAAEFSDEDWETRLEIDKTGNIKNTLRNLTLILEHDENLKAIVFNQLADSMEIKGEVPWKHPAKYWRDADDAQLISYIDSRYGNFSARNYDIAVTKVADDRSYHPIREMFESLPDWDKIPRVETVLIDYLGAQDNPYVRAVTRKALCAAYMRIYHPGIKFDHITVLNGSQGIGKSTLIAKLGMSWFSDSLTLSDMNDKTAAEKLQGFWIHEIGEMAGMKKADLEKVKAFVSRQDDKYRASFGRRVTPHPRQCIFFGTTNSEHGYLRDITGNRRFWNVKVTGKGNYKPWDLTEDIVEQIWAEVKEIAAAGERLYLDADLEEYAKQEQRDAMEQDEREGVVREYLEMLLPDAWDEMDIYRRRDYVRDREDPTRPAGVHTRERVSNIEIWCECFGKSKEDMKPADSYALSAIMTKIGGWEKSGSSVRLPIYGKQRLYVRV